MLRIKYFEEFKNGYPFVVVVSDKEGLLAAHYFFEGKEEAFLNDPAITEFSDLGSLERSKLRLNHDECQQISEHFNNLYELNAPRHAYFDIAALGDEIEVLISYNEYENLF